MKTKNMIFSIILIIISACLIVISDTVLKKTMGSLHMNESEIIAPRSILTVILNPFIISAFILGGVAKLAYAFVISTHEISRMLTTMTVMVIIGYAIIGTLQFGETFNGFKIIGLLFGLVSVILLAGGK